MTINIMQASFVLINIQPTVSFAKHCNKDPHKSSVFDKIQTTCCCFNSAKQPDSRQQS